MPNYCIFPPCRNDQTFTVSTLRYIFRMVGYDNPSNTLIVPELRESVESATHLCVFYSTNAVCHCVHRLPRNIQRHGLEQLVVEVQNLEGRTLHLFLHSKVLDVAVFTATVVATLATTGLVLFPLTSLGLFLAPSLLSLPPLFPSNSH